MWSTRPPRRPLLVAGLLVLLGGLAVVHAQTPTAEPAAAGPTIVLESRGLHYDAGDAVQVRVTTRNDGTGTIANPLARPLASGLRLTDADGKTFHPENVGKDDRNLQPERLAPAAYFGVVVDLAKHFPVLAKVGRYRLTYAGDETASNEVGLIVIEEFAQANTFAAVIETPHGNIKLDLYSDAAPLTVRNFVDLARQGFYNDLTFHYLRPADLLIGGDPRGDGTGGSGFLLPAEFNDRKHLTGTVGMVRTADPNSASSQFYICLAPRPERDGRFSVFAQVVEGFDVLEKLASLPTSESNKHPYYRPTEPLLIESITIIETEPESDPAT